MMGQVFHALELRTTGFSKDWRNSGGIFPDSGEQVAMR